MFKQSLNGEWQLRKVGDSKFQQGFVPSSVYTDLLRNGNMEDPFFKDNENKALELMNYDYEYNRTFLIDEKVLNCDKLIIRFDGIDTIADIFINGDKVGETFNMHRVWEFDIKNAVNVGENEISIILHSPLEYIQNEFKKCRTMGSEDALDGFVHIRKAHCMFGWDWGAHLPDCGIFRDVTILAINKARIISTNIVQNHFEGKVGLKIEVEKELSCEVETELNIEIISPTGEVINLGNNTETVIENPMLWWTNGLGEQFLYTVNITLLGEGHVLDKVSKRIGLRTLTVVRKKDEWGESFAHEINGKAIFACGGDYIPEDHLLGRVNRQTTEKLLSYCKMANYNAVRVWGGGYYPDDWFFDLCDEMGLIVWQDFMFACAVYELTPEFEDNIRNEFIDNVKRIRNHACLGLWCGNNEMEQFVAENHHWVTKPSEVRDYFLMYERIIPEVLKEFDNQTFYWPASPSSGGSLDEPNDPNRGDVHYWQVWHGNKPFSEYRKYFFRYASEFGFQSFPFRKTLETITDDERDLNIFSYVMEKHQRNYGANGKIMNYMSQTYLYPTSFDCLLYASQLLQADAIRYGVEHFRRNRGRCMGAIVWQINDCWPVASWSSIDYFGRWKALHYYEKRFFNPYLISCEEKSWLTEEADMNREHFEFEKSIRLNVSNETLSNEKFIVNWELRNAKAEIKQQHTENIEVDALSVKWLDKVVFDDIDVFTDYVSYELVKDGEIVSSGTVIFSYMKYFKFINPELKFKVSGDEIEISSNVYAKSVEILNENEDLILSDNYFDLNGDSKKVKVLSGDLKNLKIRSVYDIR